MSVMFFLFRKTEITKNIPDELNKEIIIPDLNPMYESLKAFIQKHQKEKEFILTDDRNHYSIWALLYSEKDGKALEAHVKAIRVNNHGTVEVMCDYYGQRYDDKRVIKHSSRTKHESIYGMWLDLKWDDYLYYVPTIFNIAENIQEYV